MNKLERLYLRDVKKGADSAREHVSILQGLTDDALGQPGGNLPEEDQLFYSKLVMRPYAAGYAQALEDARLYPQLLGDDL